MVPYDVLFVDAVFPANTFLTATWTFDTYRLTYRYSVVDNENWQVAVGATALVRVASIPLAGGGLYQVKNNVGVVPLLSFKVAWTFAGPGLFSSTATALAVPQGRAEDVFLGLRYRFGDAVSGRVGYRILEGGGDNSSVYNFALVNFLAFGFDVTL